MEWIVCYGEKLFAWFGFMAAIFVAFGISWKAYEAWKVFVIPRFRYQDPRRFGQWAVVTGATDGLGKSYARQLARRGMDVVLIGRNPQKLLTTAEELDQDYNVRVDIIQTDFSNGWEIYPEINDLLKYKEIGMLVNNVSIPGNSPCFFLDDTGKEILDMLVINLESVLLMTNAVLFQMLDRNKGAIVNICSMSSVNPCPYETVYSATKTFVHRFTRGLQREYQHTDIMIQSLIPCFVVTENCGINRFLKPIRFFVPDADTYCNSAISTLGVSDYTTGYWSHSLYYILKMVLPVQWLYNLSLKFSKKMERTSRRNR